MTPANKEQPARPESGGTAQAVALPFDDAALLIEELRARIAGRVIEPGEAGYDKARTPFIGGIDRRPALVVRPANAGDVATVVTLARQNSIELAVRSGGHSSLGHCVTEGGIVLDLGNLRALEIDAGSRTAWAETGLTAGEYTAAADAFGLATGFGDTGSVGIGGLTLGGGVGYLVRKHGLTIDHLLAADMVTADGQRVRADAENNPDLFWAIRGGGGNFGVATRFQFRLHDVSPFVGGMLILPATPEVIAAFIAEAQAAPEELSTIANIMPAPPMPFLPQEQHGRLVILAMLAYCGPVDEGQRAIQPFREMARPMADMVRPIRYPEMFPPDESDYHPLAVGRTLFIDSVHRDTAQTISEYLQASDAPVRVAQLRVLGGAMSRVPADATAYAHRQSPIMANLAAFYSGPEDRPVRQAWVADFAAAIQQGDAGAYVNFISDEDEAQVQKAYPGPTYERLAAIKARYDPTNFFRLNHNIRPASAG